MIEYKLTGLIQKGGKIYEMYKTKKRCKLRIIFCHVYSSVNRGNGRKGALAPFYA